MPEERYPRLVLLEDITDFPDGDEVPASDSPVRTLRDRRGNCFVLLSVATYVRLLAKEVTDER